MFRADGSRNEDELQRLQEKYRKRYEEARGGDFMLAESRMRDDEDAARMEAGLVGRVEGYPELVRIRAARAAFEENFGRAVAEGRYGAGLSLLRDGYDAGVLTFGQAVRRRGGMGRSRVRGAAAAGDVELETALEALQGGRGGHGAGGAQGKARGKDGKQAVAAVGLPSGALTGAGGAAAGVSLDGGDAGAGLVSSVPGGGAGEDAVFGAWDDGAEIRGGLLTMGGDDFRAAMMDVAAHEGAVRVERLPEGPLSVSAPAGATPTVERVAEEASGRGGLTREEYGEMCHSVCRAIVSDGSLDGLSDSELGDYMVKRMSVDGLEGELFADEQDPAMSYKAFVQGIAGGYVSTRGDAKAIQVKAEAALKAAEVEGVYSPEAVARDYVEPYNFRDVEDSVWRGNRVEAAERMLPEYARYRERFAAETGAEIGADAAEDLTDYTNNLEAFRDWYYKKGGVFDQKRAAFVEHNTDFVVQRVVDAVVQHRRNGGTWAEEEAVIQGAIHGAVKEVRETRGKAWEGWQERKERNAEYDARAGRSAFEGQYRERLEKMQREAEAAKKAREAEAKTAKAEADKAKKRQEAEAKLRAEGRGYELSRYYTPKEYRVKWGKFKHQTEGKGARKIAEMEAHERKQGYVTVPAAMYAEMLDELGASGAGGIVCYFGSGQTPYPVRPGDVEGIELNTAMVKARKRNKITSKVELDGVAKGYVERLKFRAM